MHLYGGAAAMLDDVIEWNCTVPELLVAFALPPAFALS